MIRIPLAILTLVATLASAMFLGGTVEQRPAFLYFNSPGCGPCQQFEEAVCPGAPQHDSAFRQALIDTYRLQPKFVAGTPKGSAMWQRYHVDRAPTFIIVDASGNELSRVTGFSNTRQFKQQMLTQLGKWRAVEPAAKNRQPVDDFRKSAPKENSSDNETREDVLRELEKANRQLEQQVIEARNALRGSEDERHQLLKRVSHTEQTIKELSAAVAERSRAEVDSANDHVVDVFNSIDSPATEPKTSNIAEGPDISVVPAVVTESGGDGRSSFHWLDPTTWFNLATTAGKIYLTVTTGGAGGLALLAGQWLLKRISRRRISGSITVDGRDNVRTETQFVTKLVDYEAEQIREAIRRVARRHAEDPRALAVIREIEGVGDQLTHGQRIIREEQKQ